MRPGLSDLDIAVTRVADILANSSNMSESDSPNHMGDRALLLVVVRQASRTSLFDELSGPLGDAGAPRDTE
jgi:hypothetical protein